MSLGFMGDFLSFVVVEHVRFFHGALQLLLLLVYYCCYLQFLFQQPVFPGITPGLAGSPKEEHSGIARYCLQCFDTVGWAIGRASGL